MGYFLSQTLFISDNSALGTLRKKGKKQMKKLFSLRCLLCCWPDSVALQTSTCKMLVLHKLLSQES